MIEMLLLESTKETLRKLRWGKEINDVMFSLYIPKWRVPKPWPARIYVDIEPAEPPKIIRRHYTRADIKNNQQLKKRPITNLIRSCEEHTKTLRYQPLGDHNEWEIGEPYIPYDLTHDCTEYLMLTVNWNLRG